MLSVFTLSSQSLASLEARAETTYLYAARAQQLSSRPPGVFSAAQRSSASAARLNLAARPSPDSARPSCAQRDGQVMGLLSVRTLIVQRGDVDCVLPEPRNARAAAVACVGLVHENV